MLKKILNFKYISTFIAGLLSPLALAPFYIIPVIILTISYLFLKLKEATNKKEAFLTGFWFGFGYFITGTYWICISLLINAKSHAWLIPFSLFGISALLAFYTALGALLFHILRSRMKYNQLNEIVLFAFCWSISEILRGYILTGFPWNLIGYTWSFSDIMNQANSIFGIYFYGLLTIFIFASFSVLLKTKQQFPFIKIEDLAKLNPKNSIPLIISGILFIALFSYGVTRLHNSETKFVDNLKIRIVQPNIKQTLKWDPEETGKNFNKIIKMSKFPELYNYKDYTKNSKLRDVINSKNHTSITSDDALDNIDTILIWPESAVPYLVNEQTGVLDYLAKTIEPNQLLITGGLRAELKQSPHDKQLVIKKLWNSIFYINSDGKVIANYDKKHLVPFGEFIPLQKYLPFISKITNGSLGLSKGNIKDNIKLNLNTPIEFRNTVCYEDIFQLPKINKDKKTSSVIINLTNDAWFGTSTGPYQHLDMARVRAIENGSPLIRVANSGISVTTDSYGRVINKTKLNEEIVLDTMIPYSEKSTIYNKIQIELLYLLISFYLMVYYLLAKNNN